MKNQFTRAREGAGLSQSQAAKLIGIEQRRLAHIENGDRTPESFVQEKMMVIYDVSYGYLLTGEPRTFADHLADGTPEDVIKGIFFHG